MTTGMALGSADLSPYLNVLCIFTYNLEEWKL